MSRRRRKRFTKMDDDTEQPAISNLEAILKATASQYVDKAYSSGSPKDYFWNHAVLVQRGFLHEKEVHTSIVDFFVDTYRYHRRHRELAHANAMLDTYHDCFEYLLRLENGYAPQERLMKDDWRIGKQV